MQCMTVDQWRRSRNCVVLSESVHVEPPPPHPLSLLPSLVPMKCGLELPGNLSSRVKRWIMCEQAKLPPSALLYQIKRPPSQLASHWFTARRPLTWSDPLSRSGMSCPDILFEQEAHHINDVKDPQELKLAAWMGLCVYHLAAWCLMVLVVVTCRNLCAESLWAGGGAGHLSALWAWTDVHGALQRHEPLPALHPLSLR